MKRESMRRTRSAEGFTIIELMTVVAVLGVLATAAIPSFLRYVRKSRTVEVIEGLDKLAAGARVYHAQHQVFPLPPNTVSGWVPSRSHAEACVDHEGYFLPGEYVDEFKAEPWVTLVFQLDGNIRYRYQWRNATPDAASERTTALGVAEATGDLDCDGTPSQWYVWLRRTAAGGPLVKTGPQALFESEIE